MCFRCENASPLCPVSLGFALGAVKGLWLLGLAWVGWLGGYGLTMIERISETFPSYAPTFFGGVIGGFFGFICGFIFGAILAFFYDLCLRGCRKSMDSKDKRFRE